VVDDPTIDTTSRTGKLVMGILALIAEFENDIRREGQMDGIAKAKERRARCAAAGVSRPDGPRRL
jgi:DNA invertase Pin-like site-specific DNA recombinase